MTVGDVIEVLLFCHFCFSVLVVKKHLVIEVLLLKEICHIAAWSLAFINAQGSFIYFLFFGVKIKKSDLLHILNNLSFPVGFKNGQYGSLKNTLGCVVVM